MTGPTLLVGLGGIGTKIVDTVYSMTTPETRKHIAVHGFDTDVNDIKKRTNLRGHMTQTSDNIQVWQCKQLCKGSVNAWFPELSSVNRGEGPLDRKPLTEGSGQIRAVSRLAYFWTMQRHGLRQLEEDVSRLFQVDGEGVRKTARIIIVSTLAGGTGAGIFLQTALYLRHLIERKFGQDAVIMRGVFLLPDILVNSHVTQEDEAADLRANAYACLKELNGIVRSVRGIGKQSNTIDLEFMPGQENPAVNMVPYDSCFMFDYENADNTSLGTGGEALGRYLRQAADSIFLQLFTPIGEANRSQEDNLIRQQIRADGLNFFASAGVARLVYPYSDILEYCALSWVQDSLEGQWLHLDNLFREELKQYDNAIASGDIREKPNRAKHYTTQMEDLGGEGSNHRFFTPLYKSAHLLDEKGRPLRGKSELFLDAVKAKVQTTLSRNLTYQGLVEELRDCPSEKLLKDRKQVRAEVQQTEDKIYALKEHVLKQLIPESGNSLLHAILKEDATHDSCLAGDDDYRLNAWILKRQEPMHPIATRYFLYDLAHKLEKEILALEEINHGRKQLIDRYESVFDIIETEDLQEDPVMRVELALKQGKLQMLLGKNDLKKFNDEYVQKSRRMFGALVHYTENMIRQDLFEAILATVRSFNSDWEQFFVSLLDDQRDLKLKIASLEQKHQQETDPTTHYLRASAKEKRTLWSEIRVTIQDQGVIEELWHRLYCSMYTEFSENYWHQWQNGDVRSVKPALTKDLLDWSREQLSDHPFIQVSLAKIMQKEQHLNPVTIIREVGRRAQPWLAKPIGDIRDLCYWGLHSTNEELMSGEAGEEAFEGAQCIVADEFSQYELVCYQAMYGLTAEDLKKFQARGLRDEEAGVYFKAYQKKSEAFLSDEHHHITHHLDKRWHVPAYLPDLNEEFARTNQEKRKFSFIYGLICKYLRNYEHDSRTIWQFFGDTVMDIKVHTKTVEEGYYNVYQALDYNPGVVDEISNSAETNRTRDLKEHRDDLQQHQFIKGCRIRDDFTLFDAIWSFSLEQPGVDLQSEMEEVIQSALDMIITYHLNCFGAHQRNTAMEKVQQFIDGLLADSSELQRMDHAIRERWMHLITIRLKQIVG